ncbi:Bug family tripartite tricarboxylate transporter substrate binding protein [Bradyrhizobium sp. McL0615]|uniref:Bug family tripartite tricarboxylate transporter substrate binding protein n=1 Tax=Bradyrhizobium sp. McL0615 TaxID=3415673 RepID=UPI003CF3BFAA
MRDSSRDHEPSEVSMMTHRLLSLTFCLFVLTTESQAQTWPGKALHVIVPFAAGTFTDIVPRIVLEQVSTQIGQAIVIENRPGAGSTTGAAAVAKATPDGYTLLVNSSAQTIAPALYPELSYDPSRDFIAITALANTPSVLVVSANSRFKAIGDLVKAAKAQPGSLNFASAGVGTATHLSAIRFLSSAGIDAIHVPFKGGREAMNEIIAGRIDFFFAPIANALQLVQEGKLAALVINSTERSKALADVPTVSEAGFSNAEYPFWIGMFLPAKTPGRIVDRLYIETMRALREPRVREKLSALGVDRLEMKPGEFDAFVQKQIKADAELARAAGLKAQ